jgi:hypothetical protein
LYKAFLHLSTIGEVTKLIKGEIYYNYEGDKYMRRFSEVTNKVPMRPAGRGGGLLGEAERRLLTAHGLPLFAG